MLEAVTLNLQLKTDDYVRVLRFMQSQKLIVRYGPLIAFGVLFLVIFGFIFLLSEDRLVSIPASLLVSFFPAAIAAGSVYLVDRYVSLPFLKFSIRRQLKSNPLFDKEILVTFDDEGISSETSQSSTSIKWDGFIRAVETQTDFLFYTSNKFSNFVPKDAFVSPSDLNFVGCLARSKLGDKAEF